MTTLAVNTPRTYEISGAEIFQDYPVIASDIIFEGAAVGDDASGYARPLVAADPFLGFAQRKADNSLGAAGAEDVRVRVKGHIVLDVVGVTGVGDVSEDVYAADDNVFTLTAGSNTKIGKVARYIGGSGTTTRCVVAFEAKPEQSI